MSVTVSIAENAPVTVPARATASLASFRAWAGDNEFPEKTRVDYYRGEVWVDMSQEQIFTHGLVKTEIAAVLRPLTKENGLGRYWCNGVLVTNVEAELSGNPDGTFISHESFSAKKVTLTPGTEGGYVEIVGTVDMVLEVVSDSSEKKDNQTLFEAYFEAGVGEYWLVDAARRRDRVQHLQARREEVRGHQEARRVGEVGRVRQVVPPRPQQGRDRPPGAHARSEVVAMPHPETIHARCCVAGGGPAGMVLGLLLARAGVEVVVLEKHADFLRDFRGDTIHPSTLEVVHELGLLDDFLRHPHQEARVLAGNFAGVEFPLADFAHLPTRCKFIALMPQWDFLDFVAGHAKKYPTFRLVTRAAVTDLIEENGRVVGVRATTPDGPLAVRAALTVGADGRHSTVRACAGLPVRDLGAPMDVLWMRLSRKPTDTDRPTGRFDRGRIFVMIHRGDYWQCGFVIPKGAHAEVKARGLDAFRADIAAVAPFVADRVGELKSWDDVKLLTVTVDRLRTWWKPGLLCIGDAAHAMSPVGGVGINLAIQDAVATANLLAEKLKTGRVTNADLAAVQRRRTLPVQLTQWLQVQVQKRVITRALSAKGPLKVPLAVRAFQRFPFLRRIPARLVGVGVRPEHVRTKDAFS